MENQMVTHQYLNARYKVVIERAASTKGVLGYKVEANRDALESVIEDARLLKNGAEHMTEGSIVVPEAKNG